MIFYIDGRVTHRSPSCCNNKELKVGAELELYEWNGGCIVVKIVKIEGNECYTKKLREEPCF